MLQTCRCLPFVSALTTVTLSAVASVFVSSPAAFAEGGAAKVHPRQIELTQRQVDGWIAVQAALQAAQPNSSGTADTKPLAKLDAIVKTSGFAGIEEYEAVSENVAKVVIGMDPANGQYVGSGPMIRKQIAEIEADKNARSAERAAALDEAKAALAAAEGAPPSAGNIAIVSRNYGKLVRAVADDRVRK